MEQDLPPTLRPFKFEISQCVTTVSFDGEEIVLRSGLIIDRWRSRDTNERMYKVRHLKLGSNTTYEEHSISFLGVPDQHDSPPLGGIKFTDCEEEDNAEADCEAVGSAEDIENAEVQHDHGEDECGHDEDFEAYVPSINWPAAMMWVGIFFAMAWAIRGCCGK